MAVLMPLTSTTGEPTADTSGDFTLIHHLFIALRGGGRISERYFSSNQIGHLV